MNFTNYLVNANMTKNRNQGEEPMTKYRNEDIEVLMKEFVSHIIEFYDDLDTRTRISSSILRYTRKNPK